MIPLYQDYRWEKGKPVGISEGNRYRIVSDPYRKWITIESYHDGRFEKVIYDSRFLDFRKLTPADQRAWRKEPINSLEAWIFNEDDRMILREWCAEDGKEVKIYSPFGHLICRYQLPGGPEGAVILYDSNDHKVYQREIA